MKKWNGKAKYVAVLAAVLMIVRWSMAGILDPTNAPGPTMHTLEDIYQKLNTLVVTNTVTVTNMVTAYTNALVANTGRSAIIQMGDDGYFHKGVAWPNPRFTVLANTNMVQDNLTGLVWARNANILGGATNWSTAVTFCTNLVYGGQSGWRLPNVRELNSLVDYGRINPPLLSLIHI